MVCAAEQRHEESKDTRLSRRHTGTFSAWQLIDTLLHIIARGCITALGI